MELNFINLKSGNKPAYGEPVLIVINGVLQHITYMLDGADDVPDWFEPYYFEHEDILKIMWNKVDSWVSLEDLIK